MGGLQCVLADSKWPRYKALISLAINLSNTFSTVCRSLANQSHRVAKTMPSVFTFRVAKHWRSQSCVAALAFHRIVLMGVGYATVTKVMIVKEFDVLKFRLRFGKPLADIVRFINFYLLT